MQIGENVFTKVTKSDKNVKKKERILQVEVF